MGLVGEGVIKSLRGLKEQGYSDTFQRLVHTPNGGSLGWGRPTYEEGKVSKCRFVPKPSPDVLPNADVEMIDADLFIGREIVLLPKDRVRITHLHGDKVTPLDFDIVAGPTLDSLGQRASLKLVKE